MHLQKNDFLLTRDPQKDAKMVAIFTVIDASNCIKLYKTRCSFRYRSCYRFLILLPAAKQL